jgi:hypothetical protein
MPMSVSTDEVRRIVREVLREELVNVSPRFRFIDFINDVGEYTEGLVVDLESEGIPIPMAYADTRDCCWAISGYFSGNTLKVVVPASSSKTLIVGSSPYFRPGRALYVEIAFYLQKGLNATVNWAIGNLKNIAEEASVFRVTFEGNDNWNLFARTFLNEFFQTKNWFILYLTNTASVDRAVYIGRMQFAELPEDFGYSEDCVIGYIPVTETTWTTKVQTFGEYAGWMGMKSRFFGVTHALNVQSDGVNTLNTRIAWISKTVSNVVDTYSYTSTTRSATRIVEFIADKRTFRGNWVRLDAYVTGGKGYISRFRVQMYLNEQAPPEYPKYIEGSYTTNGDGTEDSVTLLNYLTTPLALRYAKVKAVELSVGGTGGYAYLVIDGNTATEKVTSGSTKVIEDLGDAEQIILKANDPGGGTTIPVTYKIYYKEVKALLAR